MLGIELARPAARRCARSEAGLLINVTRDRVIRMLPPLILNRTEADRIVEIMVPLIRDFLADKTSSTPAGPRARPGTLTCDPATMTPPTTKNGPLRHFLQFRISRPPRSRTCWTARASSAIKFKRYEPHMPLHDRTLAMVFEGQHAHPRVVRDTGMYQMGGSVINLTSNDPSWAASEPIETPARVIRAWSTSS